jgi:PPOX class probable FMN-dependent enzyme
MVATPPSRSARFDDVIASAEELRALLGQPGEGAIKKELPALDQHMRAFIERSPFLLLATSGEDGRCDVSPRGDGPGFAQVYDDQTLVIPERPGNRRADSLRNILANPHVGLLFIVPGWEETLRVNGRARLVRDADVLARFAVNGKLPLLAIAVEVEECFLHCARSFKRARLWDAASWIPRDELPSLACMVLEQGKITSVSLEQAEAGLAQSYRELY